MFDKILIANRGEIACRVMRTARRLGIATVAVYSEADAQAAHVAMADCAYPIGPAPARESYLRGERIIAAALASGAQAIHPGYGFLSENAEFAEAVAAAGLVLIGPPASAMRAMGSKAAAKALMERSGVPLVPGYHGENQEPAFLAEQAARIGYPVLIKASAGGGGKGMRIVRMAEEFASQLEGAVREAVASFGDGRVLVEKYLTKPRHIEIQVFADTHGNVVSLFERDCSIQRRHQKVLEEAPAPGMGEAQRRAMGEAACAAARAVAYVGAGTVEFIAEDDAFYFMEMNTRLQVEHPVTEMITGCELVEWQLRVASGEPLPKLQHELGIRGHAIEARIYAEDPNRDFLPSIGRILHLRQPEQSASVRIDTGVREGDAISPYYDPMIAKLIVWGADRAEALRQMRAALGAFQVVGVQTNLALLRGIAADAEFGAGGVDTGFIGRHPELLAEPAEAPPEAVWVAACLAHIASLQPKTVQSPWDVADAWRLNGAGYQDVVLRAGGMERPIRLSPRGSSVLISWEGRDILAHAEGDTVVLDGVRQAAPVVRGADSWVVLFEGRNHPVAVIDRLSPPAAESAADGRLSAPIPARVVRVLAAPGDTVKRGAALLVLEAMKMELTIAAPADGVVAAIKCAQGDMVQEGAELVSFEPA